MQRQLINTRGHEFEFGKEEGNMKNGLDGGKVRGNYVIISYNFKNKKNFKSQKMKKEYKVGLVGNCAWFWVDFGEKTPKYII